MRTRQLVPIPIFLVFLISLWWVTAVLIGNYRIFPTPIQVGSKLLSILSGESSLPPSSYYHWFVTVRRVVFAFIVSFLAGTAVGMMMGRSSRSFQFFDVWCWIGITTPAILWSYIWLLVFGMKEFTVIIILMSLMAPKISFLVAEGLRAFPRDLLEMAESFGASLRQKIRHLYIPHLVSYLVPACRVSFSIGLKIVAIAEMVGINSGIGYMISYWWDEFYLAPIIAWGLLLVITNLVAELFWRLVEKRATRWR